MKDRDAYAMGIARLTATQSTCDRANVGAVIALDGRIIGTGYNGAPAGMPHCDHSCICRGKWPDHPANMTHAGPVFHADECARIQPCTVAVHAEANVIAFCAKHGLKTNGATLYTTLSPCYVCAQLIINAGITRVRYANAYRDPSGVQLLFDAGVAVILP